MNQEIIIITAVERFRIGQHHDPLHALFGYFLHTYGSGNEKPEKSTIDDSGPCTCQSSVH